MRQLLDKPLVHPHVQLAETRNGFRLTSSRWATLTVLAVSSLAIYLQVFILSCTPRVATGDQAIYLHHAARWLDGEMIYRDYDHFTFPGTDVLYMALFRIFGVRAWIPQAMLVVLGVVMAWLLLFISEKLIAGTAAYLPPLLFIALPYSSYLDATHHWYSLVAITAALSVLVEKRTLMRFFCAGALVGVGTFFTQSMAIVIVGFMVFALWEWKHENQRWMVFIQRVTPLFFGFATTIAGCMAYFIWKVGLRTTFYYTVVFVAKYYPADWFNNWRVYLTGRPHLHAWATWFDIPAFVLIHLVVPLVYIFLCVRSFRAWSKADAKPLGEFMLVNITGIFLFLSVASAPAYSRLYVVSPPALLLLVWILDSSKQTRRVALGSAWIFVLIMVVSRPLATQLSPRQFLDLPTGRTAFLDTVIFEKSKWMSERTHPSEYFFGDHLICFTLRLRNPARVPFLRPTDYTRPEEVADTIQGLEAHQVRFVSWYIGLDREKDAALHPQGNHLAPIREYLYAHYHLAQTFSNGDQIWERNR
jgi:hypothetical protein